MGDSMVLDEVFAIDTQAELQRRLDLASNHHVVSSKPQHELQRRLDLCPCSGEVLGTVEVQVGTMEPEGPCHRRMVSEVSFRSLLNYSLMRFSSFSSFPIVQCAVIGWRRG